MAASIGSDGRHGYPWMFSMFHPNVGGSQADSHTQLCLLDAWIECTQAAAGCYYKPSCQAKGCKAHALSEAWLDLLADDACKVYWFSHSDGLVPNLRGKLLAQKAANVAQARAAGKELDRELRASLPSLVPAGRATTARFCCGTHDGEFNPIDRMVGHASLNPPAPSAYCLALMFHRALIRQLYKETVSKAWRGEFSRLYPAWADVWRAFPNTDMNSVANLQHPRELLLEALGAKGKSWCVRHIVRNLPGSPQVAACVAGSWRPVGRKPMAADRKCTGASGFTVVPHAGGHLVAYHYCTTLPRGRQGQWELAQMKEYLENEVFGDEADLPRHLSRDILTQCENVCLAPAAWDAWDAGKRADVRNLFLSTSTLLGPRPAACPDVNLFD